MKGKHSEGKFVKMDWLTGFYFLFVGLGGIAIVMFQESLPEDLTYLAIISSSFFGAGVTWLILKANGGGIK